MTISLITITHPTEPFADIPFIGGRCPQNRISLETWRARSIAAMGFTVEIHAEPYDPVEYANQQAHELAAALMSNTPIAVAEAPKVEPVEYANQQAHELAAALMSNTPIAVAEAPKAEPVEPTPPAVAESQPTPAPAEPEPVLEQAEPEVVEAAEPEVVEAAEPEVVEAAEPEESESLSAEELATLRSRVNALTSRTEADALIAEYGIQLDPAVTKLKDIKSQLIAMIDG